MIQKSSKRKRSIIIELLSYFETGGNIHKGKTKIIAMMPLYCTKINHENLFASLCCLTDKIYENLSNLLISIVSVFVDLTRTSVARSVIPTDPHRMPTC